MMNPQEQQQRQQQPPSFTPKENNINRIQSLQDHLKRVHMKFQVDQTLFQTGKR